MLFSFFNKNKQQTAVQEHLSRFQDQFTENQKIAIMNSLFVIANSDDEFHEKEQQFFEQTAMLLGYQLTNNIFKKFTSITHEEHFKMLNSLNESQKDWYIYTAFVMIHADGKALMIESEYLNVFLSKMGITPQRSEAVIKKTLSIMQSFN